MNPLVSAELLKARTTRALPVTAVVLTLFTVAGAVFAGVVSGHGGQPALAASALDDFVRGPVKLAGGGALLLGLLASAGEFRHRNIVTTRLAEPRPGRVLAAKVAALALVGLVLGAVVEASALVSGMVTIHLAGAPVEPLAHGTPRLLAAGTLLIALHAVLGVAVGAAVRNLTAAVALSLGWATVVEGIVPVVARKPEIAYWLPTGAVDTVLDWGAGPAAQLAPGGAVALLAGYLTAILVMATALDRVREV
jgi:ABC-2 type transport system permease protein